VASAAIAVILVVNRDSEFDRFVRDIQPFRLRDAVLGVRTAPQFFRGVVEFAFHDWNQADHDLTSSIRSSPLSLFHARAAASRLQQLYKWSGFHTTAKTRLDELGWFFHPPVRRVDEILSQYPDQSIANSGYVRTPYGQINNLLLVPVTVNGKLAKYVADTGSDVCVLSESEAKRLGLWVHPLSSSAEGFGSDHTIIGVAVADEMVIGGIELRDVSFSIESDGTAQVDGILGLTVLIALETLRWNSDGTLEIGLPRQARNVLESNLCFTYGLIAEAKFRGDRLMLTLDTGSSRTVLFQGFTKKFPDLMVESESRVSEVNLVTGGANLIVRSAPVVSNRMTSDAIFGSSPKSVIAVETV